MGNLHELSEGPRCYFVLNSRLGVGRLRSIVKEEVSFGLGFRPLKAGTCYTWSDCLAKMD